LRESNLLMVRCASRRFTGTKLMGLARKNTKSNACLADRDSPARFLSRHGAKNTVVDRVFDHASIPRTISKFFLGDYSACSPRELSADVFIEARGQNVDPARNLLSLDAMRNDCPDFE
jgi:hypothetical protein